MEGHKLLIDTKYHFFFFCSQIDDRFRLDLFIFFEGVGVGHAWIRDINNKHVFMSLRGYRKFLQGA